MAGFDPDAFLAETAPAGATSPAGEGFDPDKFLASTAPQPLKQGEQESWLPKAVTEMHNEGAKSISGAWQGARDAFNLDRDPGEEGIVGSQLKTGKGVLSAAGLPFSYPLGAARSLVGHPMASLAELAGQGIKKYYPDTPTPSHDEIFEKLGPEIDTALGALGSRGAGTPKVVAPGQGAISNEARLLTQKGRETRAGQIIAEASEDPAKLKASLENPEEIVPGSKPTTFQASGDMGIGGLERAAATKDPADFITKRAEQNAARLKALETAQQTGNPEDVAEHLRSAFRQDDLNHNEMMKHAETRAWQTAHELGGSHDPQVYGNVLRRELQNAEEGIRAQERELWNAVDPNGDFVARTGPIKQLRASVYDDLSRAAKTTVTDKEKQIAELIADYEPSVPFREITDLRSAVSTAMREERMANGVSPAYRRLVNLRSGLERAITNDVMDVNNGQFVQDAARRLRDASEATRYRATTFNATPLKEVLRREGLEGPYHLQEGAVPGKFITPGPKGHDNVSAFFDAVGREEGLPIIRDSVVASMRRSAMNQDGTINPTRLQRWMDRHQDVLRAVDARDGGNLTQSLRNAGDASRVVENVAATRKAVLDAHQDGAFGELINATDKQDISHIVGRMLGGDKAVSNMRGLSRKLTTPEARDGARKAIADYIAEKFISNTEAATTEQNLIRADQFQTFIRTKRAALEQLFTPEQIANWEAISEDIRRANRSVVSSKLPGQSNTAQDLYAIKNTGLKMSLLGRAIAYLTGAGAGAATGGFGSLAGIVGAHFALALRDAGIKSVQSLVTQAMLDPALARQLLQKASGKERVPALKRYSMFAAGSHVDRSEEE